MTISISSIKPPGGPPALLAPLASARAGSIAAAGAAVAAAAAAALPRGAPGWRYAGPALGAALLAPLAAYLFIRLRARALDAASAGRLLLHAGLAAVVAAAFMDAGRPPDRYAHLADGETAAVDGVGTVRLESFGAVPDPLGDHRRMWADLSGGGAIVRWNGRAEVNEPLDLGGRLVYIVGAGIAPRLEVAGRRLVLKPDLARGPDRFDLPGIGPASIALASKLDEGIIEIGAAGGAVRLAPGEEAPVGGVPVRYDRAGRWVRLRIVEREAFDAAAVGLAVLCAGAVLWALAGFKKPAP